MAEPVIVPVQLEVTDVDMSNVNFNDASKEISKSLSTVKKSIQDALGGIDASAINKPIEKAMASVEKSVKSTESAYLRYREALSAAGKSTEEYKAEVSAANKAIKDQEQLVHELSKLGPAAAPHLAQAQKDLDALIEARKQIDPINYVDKADPIQLEKVAVAYKKVLSAQTDVNKKSEEFNQTAKDNRASDEYNELVKQAEKYKKRLADLNEKSKEMQFKGATDTQWENMRKEVEWTKLKMDEVLKQMDKAIRSGKAFRFGEGPTGDFRRQYNSFAMSAQNNAGYSAKRARVNQSPYTAEYQKEWNELDKLEKKIETIRDKYSKMMAQGASKSSLRGLSFEAEQLSVKFDEARNRLLRMVEDGKAFKFGDTANVAGETDKIRETVDGMQSSLSGVSRNIDIAQGGLTALAAMFPKIAPVVTAVQKVIDILKTVSAVVSKAVQAVAKVFNAIKSVMSKVASSIKSVVGKVSAMFRGLSKIMSGLFNKSIMASPNTGFSGVTKHILAWGLGLRTVYSLIKRLRTTIIDGLKMIGDKYPEVGKPIMEFTESLNRLKGSFAAIFQPVVSFVLPALTKLMNYLSGVLDKINEFTAVLTGQGYVYKAIAKNVNSVASAAKNANKQLGSYDKLEVIQQNDQGYDYDKQILGSAESAASSLASMIKEAWEKGDFSEVAQVVTAKILGVLAYVEMTVVPAVVGFVNNLLTSANTFLDNFDARAIGEKVGSIINAVIEGVEWDQLGTFFGNLWNTIFSFYSGIVNTLDWSTIGKSISSGLNSFIDEFDADAAVTTITGFANGIVTVLDEVFENVDWDGLMDSLLNNLSHIFKEVGTKLRKSNNPILSAMGTLVLSMQKIIEAIGPIIDSVLPVLLSLLAPITDIIAWLVDAILPVVVALFESLMPVISSLANVLLPFLLNMFKAFQPILDSFVNVFLKVTVKLLEAVMPLIDGVLTLLIDILTPVTELVAVGMEIIVNVLDVIITLLAPLLDLLGFLCKTVGSILRPILDSLRPILELINHAVMSVTGSSAGLAEILQFAVNVIKVLVNVCVAILVPALEVIVGISEFLINVVMIVIDTFTLFGACVTKVFSDLVSAAKTPGNKFIGFIEGIANTVIKAVNQIIKALNKLSWDVPDWVPGIGGETFGFNIKELREISIPRLAQGAVIPPNKEFLAMLGDQKHGTNIEAPLDTIKQALAEVLAEVGGAGSRQPIILQVNGRTLAQVVWDEQEKRYKQTGKAMA